MIPEHGTTGDGTLTGLALMARMAATGKTLHELASVMQVLPQTLINVPVEDKSRIATAPEVQEAIADAEQELGETGRVLLRPSGTEELFRVMVEAAEATTARKDRRQAGRCGCAGLTPFFSTPTRVLFQFSPPLSGNSQREGELFLLRLSLM